MHEESFNPSVDEANQPKYNKKIRKAKAEATKNFKNYNTRRRKDLDSSDENPMPAQIPKSSDTQIIPTVGRQNELLKLVIRIPFALLESDKFEKSLQLKIQGDNIEIFVQKLDQQIIMHSVLVVLPQQKQPVKDCGQVEDLELEFDFWGRFVYISKFQVQNKVIKKVRKQAFNSERTEMLKIKLKEPSSDLMISLNLRAQEYTSEDSNGLVNQGNTCYMNSYLQTLYHIPAFRNLVYEAEVKDESRFPATLQGLFFNLHHAEKSVSPQGLVKSFGWGKKEASIQQDAQQFSCLFFEILERKLGESTPPKGFKSMTIRDLFKGERQNYEEFIDLQLPIYPTLQQAFDAYTTEEHLQGDNKFLTEDFGYQEAFKGVRVSKFPPVLMIQLKRFHYDFNLDKNVKILDSLEYEETIDLSKWSAGQSSNMEYELYAVMVHEGSKAESGHYYNFVKSEEKWYKCNDECVQEVNKEKVFNYNFGGFHESLEFDARQMKVQRKFVESRSTAYMLVYISKSQKPKLMADQLKYPDWLEKQVKNRAGLEEEKKTRKLYLHNIHIIDWDQNLRGKSCASMGFLEEEIVNQQSTIIPKIRKDAVIAQWLRGDTRMEVEEPKADKQAKKSNNGHSKKKSKMTEELEDKRQGLYAYYVNQQKEVMNTLPDHQSYTMHHLLKDLPDPYLIKTPVQSDKSQYLVICKKFTLTASGLGEPEQNFIYDKCLTVSRQINFAGLRQTLKGQYEVQEEQLGAKKGRSNEKNKDTFRYNYYIDDWKTGCIQITSQKIFLPPPTPNRNQLLVCVIEEIDHELNADQLEKGGFKKWYQNKKSTVDLIVVDERNNEEFELKEVHCSTPVAKIRQLIYSEILKDDKEFQSEDNIVIKARFKKSSKVFSEAFETDITLKDMTKYEVRIRFAYSALTVESRVSNYELSFYYRFADFKYSQPFKIVADKSEDNKALVKKLKEHPEIKKCLHMQKSRQAILLLFSKDRHAINDMVDDEGKIPSKGDLDSVLKKEKNAVIVLESLKTLEKVSSTGLSNRNSKMDVEASEDDQVYIMVQHVSQNLERVGEPQCFRTEKRIELSELRTKTLDLIMNEVYDYQDKKYQCNPFKLQLRLFGKDSKKVIQLEEQNQVPTLKTLKIEEDNRSRKPSVDLELSPNNVDQEAKSVQMADEAAQKVVENSGPPTIRTFFKKSKALRLQVVHNEMIKPNIALKFNVDS